MTKNTPRWPVDWFMRDERLSEQVRQAAAKIAACEPPQRVTRAAINRLIGNRSLSVQVNQKKLPKTAVALVMLTETVEAIQCRRARWLYEHWPADVPVTAWRLRHEAGVASKGAATEVIEFINKLVTGGPI